MKAKDIYAVALGAEHPRICGALLGLAPGLYRGLDQQQWLRQMLGTNLDLQQRLLMPGVSGSMASWYARATVFVLPSRFEGFPNVLLEAMAAGCACIASDCLTGPADLISHGENGLLLPVEATAEDWVDAISGLLRDPDRRRWMGEKALLVREQYGEQRLRRDCLEAMRRLCHG